MTTVNDKFGFVHDINLEGNLSKVANVIQHIIDLHQQTDLNPLDAKLYFAKLL